MPNTPANVLAGGTIRPSRFVKHSATENSTVLEADANELLLGISQEGTQDVPIPGASTNAAEDGDLLQIYGEGDICSLELGGTVVQNDRLKSDADGKGVVIATTGTVIQHFGARTLMDGVSGDIIRVQVLIGSERPALS